MIYQRLSRRPRESKVQALMREGEQLVGQITDWADE